MAHKTFGDKQPTPPPSQAKPLREEHKSFTMQKPPAQNPPPKK